MQGIDSATEVVDWYNNLTTDYNNIGELMNARRILSTNIFYIALEVGTARKELKRNEYLTEQSKRTAFKDLLNTGLAVNKCQELARFESLNSLEDEKETDGIYYNLKIIFDATNGVLDTMNQHISNLKKELEEIKKEI